MSLFPQQEPVRTAPLNFLVETENVEYSPTICKRLPLVLAPLTRGVRRWEGRESFIPHALII